MTEVNDSLSSFTTRCCFLCNLAWLPGHSTQ